MDSQLQSSEVSSRIHSSTTNRTSRLRSHKVRIPHFPLQKSIVLRAHIISETSSLEYWRTIGEALARGLIYSSVTDTQSAEAQGKEEAALKKEAGFKMAEKDEARDGDEDDEDEDVVVVVKEADSQPTENEDDYVEFE